jgi:hypothetical protein
MLVLLLICIALMSPPAFAGWHRQVDTAKGSFNDSPPPHPLAYFQVDPCLRPNSDALVRALECTWDGAPPPTPAEQERRANTHADLVEVGKIGEFEIFDLWYPDVRSVLVKMAPEMYREINVKLVRRRDQFPSSEIIRLGDELVLIVKSNDGGNNNRIDQVVYTFRQSGPEQVDFKAVHNAAEELIPPNMSIRTAADDFASMTYKVEAYRNDLNLPPVSVTEGARITITYRFVDGHAVVTNAKYEP